MIAIIPMPVAYGATFRQQARLSSLSRQAGMAVALSGLGVCIRPCGVCSYVRDIILEVPVR